MLDDVQKIVRHKRAIKVEEDFGMEKVAVGMGRGRPRLVLREEEHG